jgi:hypothetical protein
MGNTRERQAGVTWGAGLHVPIGGRADGVAYERYIGRWSRLFVPTLLNGAEIRDGDRVLESPQGRARLRNRRSSASGNRDL